MHPEWAGKESIARVHQDYPQLTLYQTEQECGNGYNDWAYCNYAWGLLKHVSRFVQPTARRLSAEGNCNNLLAFRNPDKSIVIIAQNEVAQSKKLVIKIGDQTIAPELEPGSFNTFYLK